MTIHRAEDFRISYLRTVVEEVDSQRQVGQNVSVAIPGYFSTFAPTNL